MAVIDVPVKGMTCQACEVRVTKALRAVPGVTRVKVSVRQGVARMTCTAEPVRPRTPGATRR